MCNESKKLHFLLNFATFLDTGVVLASPMVAVSEEMAPHPCVVWCLQECLVHCCKYGKLVPNSLEANLGDNELVQRRIQQNPLEYDQPFPLCTADQVLRATMSIQDKAKELRTPIFICHGEKDFVTDCELSKTFYNDCGCEPKDKTLKLYEGAGHCLFDDAPEAFTDSVDWMMQRVSEEVPE